MRLVGGVMFGLILVSILVELVRLLSTLRILLPLVSIIKSKKKATVQFHLDNLLVTGTFAASARWVTRRRYFAVVI